MVLSYPTFTAGRALSISLIMAIDWAHKNAHVLRMGLQRQHLWLSAAVFAMAAVVLIDQGVLGLPQLGGQSDKLHGALASTGMVLLAVLAGKRFHGFCVHVFCHWICRQATRPEHR